MISYSKIEEIIAQIFTGIVENREFRHLWSEHGALGTVELTSIHPRKTRSPEGGKIDLMEFEGKAIAVQGNDQRGLIYSASVIDTGGPILSDLVKHVLEKKTTSG